MPRLIALAMLLVGIAGPSFAADNAKAPYSGQQNRAVKAYSDEEVVALLNGDGMGMAKSAELNGYPGPAHVLALADELKLGSQQRQQVQAIFDRMKAAAKLLGAELVERERRLDGLFASGAITPEGLSAATVEIAELQGRLRTVHLSAHVETRVLLNPSQNARYEQLRGYGDPQSPGEHHHHHG